MKMASSKQTVTWMLLVAISALTWIIEPWLLRTSFYVVGLVSLASASVLLGAIVLWKFGVTPGRIVAVLLLLVIGQWRLLQMLVAFVLWGWGGFAP
jgi:hypothetical protein